MPGVRRDRHALRRALSMRLLRVRARLRLPQWSRSVTRAPATTDAAHVRAGRVGGHRRAVQRCVPVLVTGRVELARAHRCRAFRSSGDTAGTHHAGYARALPSGLAIWAGFLGTGARNPAQNRCCDNSRPDGGAAVGVAGRAGGVLDIVPGRGAGRACRAGCAIVRCPGSWATRSRQSTRGERHGGGRFGDSRRPRAHCG